MMLLKAVLFPSLIVHTALAQCSGTSFANRTTWPNEQTSNVTKYLTQAEHLVTDPRLYQYFMEKCIVQQVYPHLFSQPPGYVKPFKAFDNLYFVGHTGVSSWAITTTEGIILIDTLNNPGEVDKVMLPMLTEMGLKGEDIKKIIVTHEHLDHYGGALYLQNKYNATVYGSAAFWDAIVALPANATPPAPRRGEVVSDTVGVTLGDTSITVIETPGHTLGTISLSFPVSDNGVPHIAGLMGGTGTPAQKELREMKVQSGFQFAEFALERGIDALVSNHQAADHAVQNADILEHRATDEPNPFVIGVQNFVNYLKINAVCSQVIAARQGMDLDVDRNHTVALRERRDFVGLAFGTNGAEHECTH
ncbi:beta-lactamase-like protein [Paraphoma chrysanthemicola]|uniref:Beta-lactamase-like protein n=1 Tax=Paraphoma chrysanthemicola TaxID=798071 RepID=A0A8K0QU98_9PLEO|nr:beta-lactamase-like protein [Paraphoma chrysanthemicola]